MLFAFVSDVQLGNFLLQADKFKFHTIADTKLKDQKIIFLTLALLSSLIVRFLNILRHFEQHCIATLVLITQTCTVQAKYTCLSNSLSTAVSS
jgi:hypothetical protein